MTELSMMVLENLKSMGYEAELKEGIYEKGSRQGRPRNEVHIKTGAPVNVFLDLADEQEPKFFSFANFTLDNIAKSKGGFSKADWVANKKEGGVEKYNQEQGFEFARRYEAKMIVAYAAARDGISLDHYVKAFKLDNYKTRGQAASNEIDLGSGLEEATESSAEASVSTPEAAVPLSKRRPVRPSGLGQ